MPTIPETLQLALQHHQAGRLQEAEALYRRILESQPDHPDALYGLGLIAHQVGRHADAVEFMSKAIAADPAAPEFHNGIGEVYRALGRLEDAAASYHRALALNPGFAAAHYNLGLLNSHMGRLDEAEACYRRALAANQASAETHNNLGNVLKERGKNEEAVVHYRQALVLKPDFAEAHNNLGVVLQEQGKVEAAAACYRQALALKPDYFEAINNLGGALTEQGRLDEAVVHLQQAFAIQPDDATIHSGLLFCLHYSPAYDPTFIFSCHKEWNNQHAGKLASQIVPHGNRRESERPLRVGYVSADFMRHSIRHAVEPVLAMHDKAQVEVYCYSMVVKADDVTARMKTYADHWRSIVGMRDAEVAELIRADEIDILVDLSGHTAGNRLLVFARKPAPVQVTWPGYCNTTGLEAMDYLTTDRFLSPPDEGGQMFTEQLIRLPGCRICYSILEDAPPVTSCPVRARGYPTFGCFNNLAKVNAEVIAIWAQILHRVPAARLVLTHKAVI